MGIPARRRRAARRTRRRRAGPHGRRTRRRAPRRRPRDQRRHAESRGGPLPATTASPPPQRPLRREADHANLRPPHPHERAHDRRLPRRCTTSGVRAVVEPSFWLGQPRTNVGSFVDYFDGLIGWERFRAAQYGIRHHCTIGLNPKEANDARCREVLDVLPRYLAKDGVVAVGELGYDSMTAEEDEVFAAQLALAVDVRAPGDGAHAAPRQGRGHAPHPRRGPRVGHRARARRGRPPQRDDGGRSRRQRLLDGLLDLPRHQDGRASHGRDPAGVRHRARCSSTPPPTGATPIR